MSSAPPNFCSVWIVVVGLRQVTGEPATPSYIAVLDTSNCIVHHIGMPKLGTVRMPPFPTGPQSLILTENAEDLFSLCQALGWRAAERVIDLGVEFRNLRNCDRNPIGTGFAGALCRYGLPLSAGLIEGSAPEIVRARLHAVFGLFERMSPDLDWGRALLRGRYLSSVASIVRAGVPVDVITLSTISNNWRDAKPHSIRGFGPPLQRFDTEQLTIGRDGRNRTPLMPFASRTGRNQPSAKSWIFGGPKWMRYLICPKRGTALALVDWSEQEFGIGAALSRDPLMQKAYQQGDAYIGFAIAANAAPLNATKASHREIREYFKLYALGLQNGMGTRTLAGKLKVSHSTAEALAIKHKSTFSRFWAWSDAVEANGRLTGTLRSEFGWQVAVTNETNPRFLRNFPMQANGAEMLRLACCLVTEAGICVCATLHDALLIEAKLSDLDDAVATTRRLMAQASEIVLGDFSLRTEVQISRFPGNLGHEGNAAIWNAIRARCRIENTEAIRQPRPAQPHAGACSDTNTCPI